MRSRYFALMCFLIACISLISCNKEANTETTIVFGIATTAEDKEALKGVTVRVGFVSNSFDTTIVDQTETDPEGYYSMRFAGGDEYRTYKMYNDRWGLWFSKSGYADLNTSARVSAITEYNLELMKK